MDFFDSVVARLNSIYEFITSGIYDFFVDSFALLVEYLTVSSIKFTIWSMSFAWDVSKSIIEDLGISDTLNNAWSTLPGDTVSILSFFGVPDMVNMLVTAIITSYTLKFIPFSGK